jgi:hypothetical protein
VLPKAALEVLPKAALEVLPKAALEVLPKAALAVLPEAELAAPGAAQQEHRARVQRGCDADKGCRRAALREAV